MLDTVSRSQDDISVMTDSFSARLLPTYQVNAVDAQMTLNFTDMIYKERPSFDIMPLQELQGLIAEIDEIVYLDPTAQGLPNALSRLACMG